MRLLITGICGFVGSTLAEALQDHCDAGSLQITGIDNFSRNGAWLNRERLLDRGIQVTHGDIRQQSDLENIGSFDWVIDAAANPSVLAGVDGKASSRQLVEHNLCGTINLLEACKRWDAGFILLSTSRVYSIPPLASLNVNVHDQAFRPSFRTDQTTRSDERAELTISDLGITERFSNAPPVSLYGATKLTSESLALEYGLAFGFPVWINRCGVLAGARQFGRPDQGIFAFWLHSWRERRPLKYIGFDGCGHQVRDCLHPRDLAPLVLKQISMKRNFRGDRAQWMDDRIFNISGGSRSARSLHQLSDWCANRWGAHAVASDSEPRAFDLPWVVLDHTLATAVWDWEPQTPVEAILNEIADFADLCPEWLQASA